MWGKRILITICLLCRQERDPGLLSSGVRSSCLVLLDAQKLLGKLNGFEQSSDDCDLEALTAALKGAYHPLT